MAFQRHVSELLQESGEYVDVQALTPARGSGVADPGSVRPGDLGQGVQGCPARGQREGDGRGEPTALAAVGNHRGRPGAASACRSR